MSNRWSRQDGRWNEVSEWVDRLLVPAAFATLSVLVGVQLLTAVPWVRHKVDATAGRFILTASTPTELPASAREASVTLYASPEGPSIADVRVFVNGHYIGNFASSSVKLKVRSGDQIELVESKTGGTVEVTFDDNDAYLLYPLPGITVTLSSQNPTVSLPPVRFAT